MLLRGTYTPSSTTANLLLLDLQILLEMAIHDFKNLDEK